jgi:hypothetical protein
MPSFIEYGVEVDVDVDITVDEFVSECSPREIKELITTLIEDGHLLPSAIKGGGPNMTANETEFVDKANAIANKYYQMSNEDVAIIESLHKKYC